MKLHILTLTWDGLSKLENLKDGLFNNINYIKEKLNYDSIWYIRDNGSKDNTLNIVNNWNVKLFDIGHNRDNFSQGVNYLFDKTNSNNDDLILLLNNDIKFNDNISLYNMISLMKEDVGIVGARLLYPNTNRLQHAGVIFSKKYGMMPYHFRPNEESDENSKKNRYFQAVTAACMLVKVSEFKKYYMNIKYFFAFEDIDLALNIGKNKKIIYCGKTNISHFESASLKNNPVNKMYLSSNVNTFKDNWFGKYKIDHDLYLNDPNYNLVK